MDDRLAGRDLHREIALGEAAADAEDQVGFAQELMHRSGHGEAAGAERKRVRFGECALAFETGGDGDGEQLGQLLQLAPGFCPVHALAGIKDRALGLDEHLGGFANGNGIGPGTRRTRGRVVERVDFLIEEVDRHFHQHRAAAAGLQPRKRAPEHDGDFLGRRDGLG